YRHEGLPPGPICSPGLAAIEAVMNATPKSNDLYFVARGQGHHIFAPTYEKHLANIAFVRGKKAALAARANPEAAAREAEPDSGETGDAVLELPPSTKALAVVRPGTAARAAKKPVGVGAGATPGGVRAAANPPEMATVVTPGRAHPAHPDSAPRPAGAH